MNQLELNKQVAEAYGVDAEREEIKAHYTGNNLTGVTSLFTPLHQDTITLFRLCIEHGIHIEFYWDAVDVNKAGYGSFESLYSSHPTKELATCAAMFAALAKFKGIENEI